MRSRGRGTAYGVTLAAVVLTTACSTDHTASRSSAGHPPVVLPAPAVTADPATATPAIGLRRHPNVLVITADDMRADDLRWMPHTRRLLGGTGLTFRNSFSPNPLCCPARASFLTGKYSHNHRVLSHEKPYGFGAFDDSTTLATGLRRAGYRTALVGKYLNGYGDQPTHRAHRPSLHYVPPGWSQWYGSTDHHWRPGEKPGGSTYAYFDLTSNVNGALRNYRGRYTTGVTAEQTQGLLHRFTTVRPAKPWFIWWTPVAPHFGGPREPDDPGTTRRSDGAPVEWVTPARPDWVKQRFDRAISNGAGTPLLGPAEGDVTDKPAYIRSYPPLTLREKIAERTVTRQRAEALYVLDLRIADTLRALRRTGQAGRTLVVFSSDNGYYIGEHRKRQGKITLHEPSVRVPLLMAGAGVPHGRRFDPVTVEDLAVTIARMTGARLPHVDGADLRSTILHGDRGWTRPIVMEGLMGEPRYAHGHVGAALMQGLDTMAVRTARWKLIRYSTGETEVYDLQHDPLELRSLHGPASLDLRRELLQVWRRYAACAGPSCRAALPPGLRAAPAAEARITRHQERQRHHYFRY